MLHKIFYLFRYDPRRIEKGLNPFQLDSKKIKAALSTYLDGQNRFEQLKRADGEMAGRLHKVFDDEVNARRSKFRTMAMDDFELLDHLKNQLGEATSSDKVMVLYGSETGTAEQLSSVFASEFKRRGLRASVSAMDDFDVDDLQAQTQVFCVVATCGQGELPGNCKTFYEKLSDKSLPSDFLKVNIFSSHIFLLLYIYIYIHLILMFTIRYILLAVHVL